MQKQLLDKPLPDKASKKSAVVVSDSRYYQMKDEEMPQIELNKVKMKKVFLSGSEEDEEEKQQQSQQLSVLIPDQKVNYDDQITQRSSQIGVQEDAMIPMDLELVSPEVKKVTGSPKLKGRRQSAASSSSKKGKKKKDKYKAVPFQWSTYRFLLGYPLNHKKMTLCCNGLIIMTAVIQAYLPMLIGELLDSTTSNQNAEKHESLSFRFLYILVVYAGLKFCTAFSNQIWQETIYNDMREDVLRSFLTFDLNFFNSYRNGEIISRMTNDLASAKSAVSGNIIVFFRNVIMLLFTVVVLFALSWKLTLAVLISMPIFTICTLFFSRLAKKFEKIGQEYQARLTALADEIVSGVVTVKSFCAEEKEILKFRQQLKLNLKLATRRGVNNGFYQAASSLFTQLGSLIVLWYGGNLILNGNQENQELSPGELASFIFYSMQLSSSSANISEAYSKIITATGAFQGVLDMLKYDSLVKEKKDAIDHINISGRIQFKNVYFQYPNTNVQVLKAFDLTITCGEYIAFVGPSGSGKSTIVQLIERFYDPQIGKILLDDLNIKQFKLKDLRKAIGLVSQETTLFEGTIESNITYGIDNYSQQDLEWATRAAGVWTFVTDKINFPNGFKTYVGEHGYTLSGGQKQRIAIARALIKRPKILIFDEATSALDAESEFQVQSAIDELIQKENKSITILVIAHRLSTIVNCNRIIVLQNGQVVEMGTHHELIAQEGVYRQLVERQLSSVQDSVNRSDIEGDTEAQ